MVGNLVKRFKTWNAACSSAQKKSKWCELKFIFLDRPYGIQSVFRGNEKLWWMLSLRKVRLMGLKSRSKILSCCRRAILRCVEVCATEFFFLWKCEKNTLYWVYRMNTTTGNITPLPVSLADVSESTRGWLNVGVIDATTQCLIQWPTTYTNWCPVLSFQLPFPSMSLWNNDRWTWTTVVCFQFSLSVTARMRQAIHEQ